MIQLAIPYLLVVLLLVIIFCLYKKWYIASVCLLIIAIACNWHFRVFPINIGFVNEKSAADINVLTLNINGAADRTKEEIESLAKHILRQDADVVFLAEDFGSIEYIMDSLLCKKYSYSTYNQKLIQGGHYYYSKYPLGTVEHVEIESTQFSYCFKCPVNIANDTICIFGVHMASNNYKANSASIRPENITGVSSATIYFENIELARVQRSEEVTAIVNMQHDSQCTIIMGDFNDVSGSKPLNILEDTGFQDAWWEGGFGYGATIHHPFPYRIDHIMYNDGLELVDIKKVDSKGLSDHDGLVANFKEK